MAQVTVEQAFQLAMQHHKAGRLREAKQIYRQILGTQPDHAPSIYHLGVLAHQVGRDDTAEELIRKSIAITPNYASHNNLGNLLKDSGRIDDAITEYRRAIVLGPKFPEAYYNLGLALEKNRRFDEAIAAFRGAIARKPDLVEPYMNLGVVQTHVGFYGDAATSFRQALALRPGFPDAMTNLGNALSGMQQFDQAVGLYREAIALAPQAGETYYNLGLALKNMGQLDDAIAAFRQAIALKPESAGARSALLLALYYHPEFDARKIADENRQWNDLHAKPLQRSNLVYSNDRDPDRRLRIGYVSADFWDHASARFLLPLFANHDQKNVELFCYADLLQADQTTRDLQRFAAGWHMTGAMTDEQVAELIVKDRIDILVDLKLHTGHNRLLTFARKPAPVQVTWLGYPGSTGLAAIDYRLSDPYLDPVGIDESIYSEKTVRLPDTFWCYDPLNERDIPVNPLPAIHRSFITFGCLNNFCKVNDHVLALWAKVLGQVDNSRLLLLAAEGSHRQHALDRLKQEGVDPNRIDFAPRSTRREYLQLYHRIDLCLDTFPYNGHTTSLDSLWMGVPVVTLVGQTAVARAGLSQLSNLGLEELCATTPEQFVEVAVRLTRDLPRLQSLRASLRQRMELSPLMDAPRFARNMETAYRQMWRDWCATEAG